MCFFFYYLMMQFMDIIYIYFKKDKHFLNYFDNEVFFVKKYFNISCQIKSIDATLHYYNVAEYSETLH